MASVSVFLHFPDGESPLVEMAGVPRQGETIEWSGPDGYSEWTVTKVGWTASPEFNGGVGLHLAAVDHTTEK